MLTSVSQKCFGVRETLFRLLGSDRSRYFQTVMRLFHMKLSLDLLFPWDFNTRMQSTPWSLVRRVEVFKPANKVFSAYNYELNRNHWRRLYTSTKECYFFKLLKIYCLITEMSEIYSVQKCSKKGWNEPISLQQQPSWLHSFASLCNQ